MVPINRPILGEEERELVLKVLESGILTDPSMNGGPYVREFERELAKFAGVKEVVAVNSGTSALQIALMALGIGPGDEVVVPSFTFAATAGAVMLVGAKPIFVDIDLSTYNMSPESLKKAINEKTKAVIPVDLYGLTAEMDEINEIANDYGISVIEDACQAQGAKYKGKMAGGLGKVGCFSFYPGKVMTTGEGGAILTNDSELAEKMRMMRTHGQVKGYDSKVLGGNFRMTEISAAIGIAQLKKLPKFLEKRAENAKILLELLERSEAILPEVPKHSVHNWYLFTIRLRNLEERERLKSRLRENGIGATVYYPSPIHRLPYYASIGYRELRLGNSETASETVLSLPVHPLVDKEALEKTANIISTFTN